MKRITYALCLMLCLLSWAAQTHPQPAAAQTAQPAAAPDYAAQLQALREQSLAQEERKKEINSTEVEQLHQRYSVDELRLENQRTRQYLLRRSLQGVALLVGAGLIGTLLLVWRRRKVLQYQAQLTKAIGAYQTQISNTNLFLSNMSHEIRTPLNALSGFADLLATPGVDGPTQRACNEMIGQNSELLRKLMNDVIAFSCTNPQQMLFSLQPTDVVQLCQRVVATLNQVKTTRATLSFETECSQLLLHTDATRLQQVLINLLMNANKFTAQGTIVLQLEQPHPHEVRFTVTDTGQGIALSDQARLFKRFEKLNEQAQGTGLGLAICKVILKRLGGDIWIDSSYTQGARFVCTHPYNVGANPHNA